MLIEELKNKLVAVLGYGQEGEATTAYLVRHGIKPVLFDQKPWENWGKIEQSRIKKLGVNFIFGHDAFSELAGFDIAFRSPGIKLSQLSAENLNLTSQTKWFFDHCPAKIIGVTGTKGKGTTASLIYEILMKNFRSNPNSQNPNPNIFLTGNIGKVQPLEILDNLTTKDWVVYELSSFQLQDLHKSPHIGVVLMITSEHLDYHADVKDYIQAKSPICKFQESSDFTIINANFQNSLKIGRLGNGKKLYFNTLEPVNKEKTDDSYISDGQIYLKGRPLIAIKELQLKGEHNLQNMCAAILASSEAGCSDAAIKNATVNFKGLEHRLEFVSENNGIKFYNDSFSTTPETAIAAIKAFSEKEILVLGGSSKNSDFSALGKVIENSKNVKAIILIGNEAENIKKTIGKFSGQIIEGAKTMTEIFEHIKSIAEKGDVVILSPACASFDMFENYMDRGKQFKNLAFKFNS